MKKELLEGYVVDLACVRRYPSGELAERAREHTKACAVKGHCIESGYALIDDKGRAFPLDSKATAALLDLLRKTDRTEGLRARVERRERDGEMETVSAELL